jgi:hypothetical protein
MLQAVGNESEKWAQEAALKTLHELYAQYGNWDKVRNVWLLQR